MDFRPKARFFWKISAEFQLGIMSVLSDRRYLRPGSSSKSTFCMVSSNFVNFKKVIVSRVSKKVFSIQTTVV